MTDSLQVTLKGTISMVRPAGRLGAVTGPYDEIILELQQLRITAGEVSYAEITRRITAQRVERGTAPAAARIARSTVFDTFTLGRKRLNPDLIEEIVLALGATPGEADSWRERCLNVKLVLTQSAASPQNQAPQPTATQPPVNGQHPLRPIESPSTSVSDSAQRHVLVTALLVGCVALNIFGGMVNARFGLPFFLDMVGTAIAAVVIGPWSGVLVGVSTNLFGMLPGEVESLAFAPVNAVGAIIWGLGARRFRGTLTFTRFMLLSVLVAFACSMIAAPISVMLFQGSVAHASTASTALFSQLGHSLWTAVFSANILSSLTDKIFTGVLAYLAIMFLDPLQLTPTRMGDHSPVP